MIQKKTKKEEKVKVMSVSEIFQEKHEETPQERLKRKMRQQLKKKNQRR